MDCETDNEPVPVGEPSERVTESDIDCESVEDCVEDSEILSLDLVIVSEPDCVADEDVETVRESEGVVLPDIVCRECETEADKESVAVSLAVAVDERETV